MITVAVTGGIGSGKSTVSSALAERGAVVIDSDQLARQVVAPGSPGLAAIAEAFGPDVIDEQGALARPALAAIVFSDPAARAVLEGITHPLVRAAFAERQQAAAADAVVVNDIPILTTLAVAAGFALVIGVQVEQELRVSRLIGRGMTESDARARIGSQITDIERAALCDVLLNNDGERSALMAQIDGLWDERLIPFEENTRLGRRVRQPGPAVLIDSQPCWADAGLRLAARVSAAAGGARVDHIGSTAIPAMPAKNVIDLQLTVPDLATADALAERLRAAGFPRADGYVQDTPHPAGGDPKLWEKRLHGSADPGRSVHLHLRVRDSPGWRWALLFRDWLTAEPDVAADYLQVKRAAAAAHSGDRTTEGYTLAKEPWMAEAYPRGLAWAERAGWTPGA